MKKFIFVSLILISVNSFYSCKTKKDNDKVFWTENNSPQIIGRKVISDLISRHEIMMYRTPHLNTIIMLKHVPGWGQSNLPAS